MKRRQMTAADRDVVLSRVIGVTDDDESWRKHMSKADLVVEAVFEDLGVKHKVVRAIAVFVRCLWRAVACPCAADALFMLGRSKRSSRC